MMNSSVPLYPESFPWAGVTDFYQISMAYAAYQSGIFDTPAWYSTFLRKNPFGGGFTLTAGLDYLIDIVAKPPFPDRSWLDELNQECFQGKLSSGFLDKLHSFKVWPLDIDAVLEGEIVFPNEPIVRVRGPYGMAQIFETLCLNVINPQSLIATKAARIRSVAQNRILLEFGLRRCQGFTGFEATRSSYIGGFDGTSNVHAGLTLGIPVRGTHAHAWVQFWNADFLAFDKFRAVFPDNCILLVDTFDVESGIDAALKIGKLLVADGIKQFGIRLDSGDLVAQSKYARGAFHQAEFPGDVRFLIFASDDLDEYRIADLLNQGGELDGFGIGTKLVTAYDQPSAGGVYKLTGIDDPEKGFVPRIKLSSVSEKVSLPGQLNFQRYVDSSGRYRGDIIFDDRWGVTEVPDALQGLKSFNPMVPVLRSGYLVPEFNRPSLIQHRDNATISLASLPPELLRLEKGTEDMSYPVFIDLKLEEQRQNLIQQHRPNG
jgi:nicotinate phosphoribosyltransferase